ncbi:MAG: diguanylate cyclase [Mariprofundus sp.]|nr:diguanylate cyclase [Mariprofundus sp.]
MTAKMLTAHPILLLGAGRGSKKLLQLLHDEEAVRIIGIADPKLDAPALVIAKELNIPIYTNTEEALQCCKPCLAFNLTGQDAITDLAASIIGACSIIGHAETHLIWQILSQLKNTRDELQANQCLTESIVAHAMEGIILISTKGMVKTFNAAAERIFGYTAQEVLHKNIKMLMPEPYKAEHDDYLEHYRVTKEARLVGIEREVFGQHKNGKTFPLSLSVNEMSSGNDHFFIGIVSDISERKRSEEVIRKLAHFDSNTGLPNRTMFFDRFENLLAQSKRASKKLAVLFLDLDGFKNINDTLGHHAGDDLLKQVAKRLQDSIREVDTVARFGGDEFTFLLNDVKNEQNVELIAHKIITALALPFILDGVPSQIGGSIGISMFPRDHVEMDMLINQADSAMYLAKTSGKNQYRFFCRRPNK